MSFLNSLLANTAGIAYRAATGKVDPWTLSNQNEEISATIAKQMGPEANPADVAAVQNAAVNEQNNFLKGIGEHPDQAQGLHIPGLGDVGSDEFLPRVEKIVYGALFLLGAVGVIYFVGQFRQAFGKRG